MCPGQLWLLQVENFGGVKMSNLSVNFGISAFGYAFGEKQSVAETAANYVDDPEKVQKILGPSKLIKWLGPHPEGKYPGINGWYTRTISGHEDELKIMLGKPNA